MRVLIVDDEEFIRWYLEKALRKKGYDVVSARNIKEAYDILKSGGVDILFTDLRMPEGNGAELIGRLCDFTQSIRIIVCSAFITPELHDSLKRKGIACLKKPFRLEEIEEVLASN